MAKSIPGTAITSDLNASLYPLQSQNLDAAKQNRLITDYEIDSNSPDKYKPKYQTYTTGIELSLIPGSINKDEPVGVSINLRKTDITKVQEKLHPSGNTIQIYKFKYKHPGFDSAGKVFFNSNRRFIFRHCY